MLNPDQIASLIGEEVDVNPQQLLQAYTQSTSTIQFAEFQQFCESRGVNVSKGELLNLMEANQELLFVEMTNGTYQATLSEGYDLAAAGELPEIGDGDELAGINSPAQDQDMMGQGINANTGLGAYDQGAEDPSMVELMQWLKRADQGRDAEQVEEDDMVINQMNQEENVEGNDRDQDWDAQYRDAPDGNVVAVEETPDGEAGAKDSIISKIARKAKNAIGKVEISKIYKWVSEQASKHPEIRDEILQAVVGGAKRRLQREGKELMESKFTCQECGHLFELPEWASSGGQSAICPQCETPVQNQQQMQPQQMQMPQQPQTQPQMQHPQPPPTQPYQTQQPIQRQRQPLKPTHLGENEFDFLDTNEPVQGGDDMFSDIDNYNISPSQHGPRGAFEWSHKEYGGPDDPRSGYSSDEASIESDIAAMLRGEL